MKLSISQKIGRYFGQIPLITSYLFTFIARSSWLKKADIHYDDNETDMKVNSRQGMVFQYDNNPGYVYSVFSSMSCFPVDSLFSTFVELNKHQKPILLLWGETDQTVPFVCGKSLNEILKSATLITFKDKGHQIVTQKTIECCQFIEEFFK
jgi:pimeloyl-ACP methyl ester carboxylesterase